MDKLPRSAGGLLAGGIVEEEAVVVSDEGHGSWQVSRGETAQTEKLALPGALAARNAYDQVDGGGQFVVFYHEVCSAHGGTDSHGHDLLSIALMADMLDGRACVAPIPCDGDATENPDDGNDDQHFKE